MSDLRNRKIVGRIRGAERSSQRHSAKRALDDAVNHYYGADDDDGDDFDGTSFPVAKMNGPQTLA